MSCLIIVTKNAPQQSWLRPERGGMYKFMTPEKRKRNIAISAGLAAGLFVFLLAGGIYFTGYLKDQIFAERTAQLNEITSQVRINLNNALDSHWNYLTAATNFLTQKQFDTEEETVQALGQMEGLMGTERYSSFLILLDSKGNCYDKNGMHGVWSDIDRIADGAERYTFISDSYTYKGSYWAFVYRLDAPLETAQDGVIFTHAVLMKDVYTLTEYYNSSAYGSQNETYILKSDGTRMHDDKSDNTIQAYNVLKVLEEMEGQGYPDIRSAIREQDTISTNFYYQGEEYYYCLTALKEYDTLLLFLIPADYVAPGTVKMLAAVVRMLLLLTVAQLAMMIAVAVSLMRQQASVRLFRQEQENLRRQELLNTQLEETNAMLAQSKETAEQAFRIAEEANRAKSSFLSNMSHDIRTPMNAVVGFAALLARDAEDPERVREYTRKIKASSQHLLGLINDILDISKIEAGKTTLSLSDENLVELIENIDSIIRPQMKGRLHIFKVYNRGLRHEQVIMDKLRLNQVLLNLLSNAAKYTPDGGHITFTVEELAQQTRQLARFRFIVADDGYGMSEEYQKKIFQAFTREEDSVTNRIQGTGLGMAITKNLIDLMGGAITVESTKGKGSTFTVELELQISAQAVDNGFWQKNGISRILAADDKEATCRNIQMTMDGTGVETDYVLDGQSAVEKVIQANSDGQPYHIVLLDRNMPGLGGVEAARRIREAVPHTAPLLILTSYDWMDAEEEARTAGIDAFLPKPFFLTSFRQKVDAVLHRVSVGAPAPPGENILSGKNILAAEDNELNAEILQEMLDMEGAACTICENGKLAVETFVASSPGKYDLILMDVQMPVMNGYEAAQMIRAADHPQAKAVPIIAMTANAFSDDIRDALASGMNAHVSKPLDMAVLEQTVRPFL